MVGVVSEMANLMTKPTDQTRAVVSWTGQGAPIMLALYSATGEMAAVRLSPTRALDLAKELSAPAVQSIKFGCWGPRWPG